VRYRDWSGQGFTWEGLSRGCHGALILLALPFLTTTAHAQQGSSPSETEARREEARRCEESSQAERTASGGVDLLTGLLVAGRMDAEGIHAKDISLRREPESPVKVLKATSFRSVDRVALRLEVQIPEGPPWSMEGIVLRDEAGVETPLKSWPSTPLPPGRAILILERDAGRGELKGSYALHGREAGGNRTLFIKVVDFP